MKKIIVFISALVLFFSCNQASILSPVPTTPTPSPAVVSCQFDSLIVKPLSINAELGIVNFDSVDYTAKLNVTGDYTTINVNGIYEKIFYSGKGSKQFLKVGINKCPDMLSFTFTKYDDVGNTEVETRQVKKNVIPSVEVNPLTSFQVQNVLDLSWWKKLTSWLALIIMVFTPLLSILQAIARFIPSDKPTPPFLVSAIALVQKVIDFVSGFVNDNKTDGTIH